MKAAVAQSPSDKSMDVGIYGCSTFKGAPAMTRSERLAQIAREIGRLSPDWHNPERFFENRGEIEDKLKRFARDMREAGRG